MATKKNASSYEKEDRETKLAKGADWTKRLNLDIPIWAVNELDREAKRRGISRQALIKTWLIDQLDTIREKQVGQGALSFREHVASK